MLLKMPLNSKQPRANNHHLGLLGPNLMRSSMQEAGRARGLDRAIMILEYLREAKQPVSIGEIARGLGAPRSSVYEIVNTFVDADVLAYAGAGSAVYFGPKLYLYGELYFASRPLLRRAHDEVIRLAQVTGETTQFCALVGNKYSVIHMQPGSQIFRISSDVGALTPIPWTASGRLLLGYLTDEEIRALVPEEDFRLPDGRLIPIDSFCAEVREAVRSGFAITSGLVDRFTTCLAVAVPDHTGRAIATICFVTSAECTLDRRRDLIAQLKESAAILSNAAPVS
jgi:DNA-binding IclR family transcriptional regulator